MGFEKLTTDIEGLMIITPQVFGDHRGYFKETLRDSSFQELGLPTFVQENESRSKEGVLRGLHYQLNPAPLAKLVRCVRGAIFDVAVDIRSQSSTFGECVSQVITAENKKQIWIPEGFAHGFYVLSEWADVLYKTTDYSLANKKSKRIAEALHQAWNIIRQNLLY